MDDKHDDTPREDLAFAQVASASAIETFSRNGGELGPFGMVLQEDGTMIVVPGPPIVDHLAKRTFVNLLRFISITRRGRRAAIAMESWTIDMKDADQAAEYEAIRVRGGSMEEHSKVREAIVVVVESDAGCLLRRNDIRRDGASVTIESHDDLFTPAAEMHHGEMTHFHVPTPKQTDPNVMAVAEMMRPLFEGDQVELEPVDPKDRTIN